MTITTKNMEGIKLWELTKPELHETVCGEMAKNSMATPEWFVSKTNQQMRLIKAIDKSIPATESRDILADIFAEMATNAINMAIAMGETKTFEEICENLNKVYIAKNRDYGDSFAMSYREYGLTMACIRLEDKLRRFESLTVKKQKALVLDEKVTDTLVDLANYAILTTMELMLEEESQTWP